MPQALSEWLGRHRKGVVRMSLALLLAVIAVESLLLYLQHRVNEAIEAQSAKLLTTFLHGETVEAPSTSGVSIRLQNVRFKWSDKVYVDAGNMAVRAVPLNGNIVNFDDLESFYLMLQQSVVQIRPDVLEGMFNESVFNYPNSKIRDLKVALTQEDNVPGVRTSGPYRSRTCRGSRDVSINSGTAVCMRKAISYCAMRVAISGSPTSLSRS